MLTFPLSRSIGWPHADREKKLGHRVTKPPLPRPRSRGDRMNRRELIGTLGSAAVIAWPMPGRAQPQPSVSRIGMVMPFNENDPVAQTLVAAFREELQKLGWTQ